jgi:hypothetical protein
MEKKSPFIAGAPVPPELLVGNPAALSLIVSMLKAARASSNQHLMLVGSRGMGKTSLAHYAAAYAARPELNFITLRVSLSGSASATEGVRRVFERLLLATMNELWFAKARPFFGSGIQTKGQLDVSYCFQPKAEELTTLFKDSYTPLIGTLKAAGKEKAGIALILDDLGDLATDPAFAGWYYNLVERFATSSSAVPFFTLGTGSEAQKDNLMANAPSLGKHLKLAPIHHLSYVEVKAYCLSALDGLNIDLDPEAIEALVATSQGIPIFMQEVADAAFWVDTDKRITLRDIEDAGHMANEQIGKKYLPVIFLRTVKAPMYKNAFNVLGAMLSENEVGEFSSEQWLSQLDTLDQQTAGKLLTKLVMMGIVAPSPSGSEGVYYVPQPLARCYLILNAVKSPFDLIGSVSAAMIQSFSQQ